MCSVFCLQQRLRTIYLEIITRFTLCPFHLFPDPADRRQEGLAVGGGADVVFEARLGEVGLQGYGVVARKAGEAKVAMV